ncbi:PAS domain-containing sensor histidine kinase [Alicyclobacillus suci]|uniref:PAS domain-containing sensor histidine kinase n=2 Tax=Alicyclobacillus suci TaxID=2816080 RepID=UPI001A905A56|nr:PAS domain-containing sensor histidine kinase [Alicyclobacillus suci]
MSVSENYLRHISESGIYKSFFKNHPDAVYISDLDGNYLDANPACVKIFGYSHDEFLSMSFKNLVIPERLPESYRVLKELREGKSLSFETTILNKYGHRVELHVTDTPIVINGRIVGIFGISKDITEQKRTERALRERSERYESLKKYNPNGICSIDITGAVMGANPAFERITGYALHELLGRDVIQMIVDLDEFPEARTLCTQTSVKNIELQVTHKDGYSVDVSVTSVPIIIEGEQIGCYIILEDITEQKRTRQELVETQQMYQRLVDNSRDAIGIMENGKWVFMNKAGVQLFGAANESEIIGRDYYDFLHPDHHEASRKIVEIALSGQEIDVAEVKWIKLNGMVFDAESHAALFGATSIQVIIRDITDRKRAETNMMNAEKLTAVGQLAAGVAHEIRNPLTALKGFTQMFHQTSTEANRRYFEIMKAELERIEMILSEMLVLAKPQATHFEQHQVETILREVITLLSAQAVMKNVMIQTDFEQGVPTVLCESSQLKQVFVNVIKNGIEAMPSGGNLLVRLKSRDKNVCIEFIDEGVGIEEEHIPKLGEPFYTTKEKGTGLGLMVCYKIISAHEGNMEIHSTPGKGTTVRIRLPVE